MDDVGRALRHIGALDLIAQVALADTGPQCLAQRHHAEVAEMRADAQPVEFLGGFDLTQRRVGAREIGNNGEACRQLRVLVGGQRADIGDAAGRRRALVQHLDGGADARFTAPCHVGLACDEPRLRRVVDVLHEQRVARARRQHADRLRGHRPLRQPLHR